MVGIFLNEKQVLKAPADVRRWLESQLAPTLGPSFGADSAPAEAHHLAVCNSDQAMAIYKAIRALPLTTNVFFELGREAEIFNRDGMLVFRIEDFLCQTRLRSISHLLACLGAINKVLRRVICDPHARICLFDERGYCFVALATRQSIAFVLNAVLTERQFAGVAVSEADA